MHHISYVAPFTHASRSRARILDSWKSQTGSRQFICFIVSSCGLKKKITLNICTLSCFVSCCLSSFPALEASLLPSFLNVLHHALAMYPSSEHQFKLTFEASHDICKSGRNNITAIKFVQYDDYWKWQFIIGRDGQVSTCCGQICWLSTHNETFSAKWPLPSETDVWWTSLMWLTAHFLNASITTGWSVV